MLARITQKPGQYPEAFINEFRIFTRELREFFNASGGWGGGGSWLQECVVGLQDVALFQLAEAMPALECSRTELLCD
jgi:hypothetical protein